MNIKNLTNTSLIVMRCECGAIVPQGFPHQLVWKRMNKTVSTELKCDCGKIQIRKYKLTSGRNRKRLIDWLSLGWRLLYWLRKYKLWFLWKPTINCILWLERNVPI